MPGKKESQPQGAQIQPKYPNDAEQSGWLAMAKQGYSNAFNKIVEKYQRPIYNLCYHMLNDPAEAEDAAQEVFIRAYTKLHTYDDSRRFSSWLFAIASHYCLDKLKKHRPGFVSWDDLPRRDITPTEAAKQPERVFIKAEQVEEVRQLLQTLDPTYRTAIILKYWYDMSCEEIAHLMDTTTSAIKSKLFRGRKMLAARVATTMPPITAQTTIQGYKDCLIPGPISLPAKYASSLEIGAPYMTS